MIAQFRAQAVAKARGLSMVLEPSCDLSKTQRTIMKMEQSSSFFLILAEIEDTNLEAFIESGAEMISPDDPEAQNFPSEFPSSPGNPKRPK